MSERPPLAVNGAGVNPPTAKLAPETAGGDCVVQIGGDWRLNSAVPTWLELFGQPAAANVRVVTHELGTWDTSLLLFLVHGRAWCVESKHEFIAEGLPENLQTLLRQVAPATTSTPKTSPAAKTIFERVETLVANSGIKTSENISFLGECALGFAGVLKHPRRFRWQDCFVEMQQC